MTTQTTSQRCECSKPWCYHLGRCSDNARWLRFDGERLCHHCAQMRLGGGVDPAQYYERLEEK